MKKNLLFVFSMLCALTFFTACSDDDDQQPEVPVLLKGSTDFSGETLRLTYGESSLLGKSVKFSTEDGKTGSLFMQGVFNMDLIKDLIKNQTTKTDISMPSMAPGVIPGEVTTILNVNLVQEGNKYTFEGTDSKDGRELKYAGTVDSTSMTLALEVVMPDNDLVGTWNLAPIIEGEPGAANVSQPLTMAWKSDVSLKVDMHWIMPDYPEGTFWELPTDGLVSILSAMVSPKLIGVLETVTFQKDGNIVASYKDDEKDEEWKASPINLAQYYVKEGKVFVQLNIDNIIADAMAAKTKTATKAGLTDIVLNLSSLLSEGIPVEYAIDGDALSFTMDEKMILPLLSMLTDETILQMLLPNVPEEYKAAAEGVLGQLPGIIEKTTEMNVSLHLQK